MSKSLIFLNALKAAPAGILLFVLAACSPLGVVNSMAPEGGLTAVRDIAYGDHRRQKLDLYRPTEATAPLATVLFLYGGSWKGGSREKYAFAGRSLARAGFLVAVADYRVYPEVRFPAFVDDAAMAIAWLSRNAGSHGGQTTDIHMVGHSAGAHIAALVALDRRYLDRQGLSRDVLGRWVGLTGPYAFHPFEIRSVRDVFAGLDNEDPARPITFVGPGAPPALLLHGRGDTTVYPINSQELAAAMSEAGTKASAYFYDSVGHGPLVVSITEPFTWIAPTRDDVVRYLKTGQAP